jgi:hypothetical protein
MSFGRCRTNKKFEIRSKPVRTPKHRSVGYISNRPTLSTSGRTKPAQDPLPPMGWPDAAAPAAASDDDAAAVNATRPKTAALDRRVSGRRRRRSTMLEVMMPVCWTRWGACGY